jgi:hypothetical protein
MSQYPPETLRALDIQSARWDHAEHIRHTHAELFTEAVAAGADVQLIQPLSREGKRYPVSEYLSNTSVAGSREALFKACTEAMNHRDCGEALRQFVKLLAADYANDAALVWSDS